MKLSLSTGSAREDFALGVVVVVVVVVGLLGWEWWCLVTKERRK